MRSLKDFLLHERHLHESLISNIKKPNMDSVKDMVDNIIWSKYFGAFGSSREYNSMKDSDASTSILHKELMNRISRGGVFSINGSKLMIDLDKLAPIKDYETLYVDYKNLWKEIGVHELEFTGNISESKYLNCNLIGLFNMQVGYLGYVYDLPSEMVFKVSHKDHKTGCIVISCSNMGYDFKYDLRNVFFYGSGWMGTEGRITVHNLAGETYYRNGNYNSWGFPISIYPMLKKGELNKVFPDTNVKYIEKYSSVVKNGKGYKYLYEKLKDYPYFPITNLNYKTPRNINNWPKNTELIFYVPGTEQDGRKQADKHLKDDSNPYTKFEFITYDGDAHKTKKEEATLKSGGFVVLSIA